MLVTEWKEAVVIAYLTGAVYSILWDLTAYYKPNADSEFKLRGSPLRLGRQLGVGYPVILLLMCIIIFSGAIVWPALLLARVYWSVFHDPTSDEDVEQALKEIEEEEAAAKKEGPDDPDHP
jgi:hypothetical protein